MAESIVFAGSLAQKPDEGGHTWALLQYLLGFRRLGWDVLFLDRLEPEMCRDENGGPCDPERSPNLRYFLRVMERFGFGEQFSLSYGGGARTFGLPRAEVLERLRNSVLLLNVMGFLDDEELLSAPPLRVFLDIDPGFGQMWAELGLADPFRGHDAHVTIGENIARPGCEIPTCGIDWVTTPQPVVLEHWPASGAKPNGRFTTIASWRGPYAPIEYRGRTYGLRVHEFRKFATLPRRCAARFEIALKIHEADGKDRALLQDNGWSLVDPKAVADSPWAYQEYIRGSLAEFMVAKGLYVQSRSGWLSDRSLCYLASGRPVLAQDTGLSGLYPTGEGLVTFTTLDEAAVGVESISRDYERHAQAARALAETYFDSDKVLMRLLSKLGVA